ncbi:MAG: NADH-quinone oxidoreductase subunit A [Candidatus Dasytiphilus stammeri]
MINLGSFMIYCIVSLGICTIILCISWLLGGKSRGYSKNIPFESGVKSVGSARLRFSAKFYLIALLFVIFDIEALYLYIWAITVRDSGWLGFFEVSIFSVVLISSLIYLVHNKALKWKILMRPSIYNKFINIR